MTRSYYSTVFEQTADQVWSVIRDFNNYTVWVEGVGESHIEEGKPGDTVGAIRNVRIGDTNIRQRLLAQSDRDRFQTYEFCGPIPYPVRNYEATLRVTPISDGNRAFVEWWATFDCEASEYDHWTKFFANSFAKWLGSLRAHLEG
jgi:Polyketide cyclase / dehydrase and lipid transport